MNYIPISSKTMAEDGSKKVEITRINDKRQITLVLSITKTGYYLPSQLINAGKTCRCLPKVPYTTKLSSGKLSRLRTKYTIHWKTFAVHQAVAIMYYCTQQVIQGENFCDRLKYRESFLTQKFCRIR